MHSMCVKDVNGTASCDCDPGYTGMFYVVFGKSCSQAKHTAAHVLPGQKMPMASFALAKDATQVWPGNRCQRQPLANHI